MDATTNNIKISRPVLSNSSTKLINNELSSNKQSIESVPVEKPKIKAVSELAVTENKQVQLESKVTKPKEEFQVIFGDAGAPGIKFQVIDKESGEVVRQYPFKTVAETATQSKEEKPSEKNSKSGLLVDVSI